MQKLLRYIAYSAGSLFILFGLAFLFTNISTTNLPSQLKEIMGIVFVLYGTYRIVITKYKVKRNNANEKE
ncbi:hypothetical protein ABRY23_09740 [Melioribacteraceae bacterium 4301-Me]|uniref:hypothetical protein n=1 Tax=Pyranulibacter aquaticus TaxID=3163344 RepID=UPI00359839D1